MTSPSPRGAYDRVRVPFLVVAAVVAVVIWIVLMKPAKGPPANFFWTLISNGGHAVLFFMLSWPLLSGLPRARAWRIPAAFGAAVYAVATEIGQGYSVNRIPSVGDVITDCAGILLGWAVVQWTQTRGEARRRAFVRVFAACLLCFSIALGDTIRIRM